MKKTKETKQSEELAVASALATESAVAPLIPSYGEKPERKLLYSFFKRLFDIVSSGLMMIVLALPIAVCLIIKWLEDVKIPLTGWIYASCRRKRRTTKKSAIR